MENSQPKAEETKETPPVVFLNLAENTPSEEITSLCMNC
jgi:zinc finger protein